MWMLGWCIVRFDMQNQYPYDGYDNTHAKAERTSGMGCRIDILKPTKYPMQGFRFSMNNHPRLRCWHERIPRQSLQENHHMRRKARCCRRHCRRRRCLKLFFHRSVILDICTRRTDALGRSDPTKTSLADGEKFTKGKREARKGQTQKEQ